MSKSRQPLADLVRDRFEAYPSSGETNFRVEDAKTSIDRVVTNFRAQAESLDMTDGVSMTFPDWRFNLRRSNTEPVVRLNSESRGEHKGLDQKVTAIASSLGGKRL